jgi:hypothetical protein
MLKNENSSMNLFFLTLRSTVTFWVVWEMICDKECWNFGATTIGSFIMTIRPPTHPWKQQSFVSQIENETEQTMFWNSDWHPNVITSGSQQH